MGAAQAAHHIGQIQVKMLVGQIDHDPTGRRPYNQGFIGILIKFHNLDVLEVAVLIFPDII